MAATTSTTQSLAYNAVISSHTIKITTLEYQWHNVKRLRREVLTASLIVSSTYRGGNHGNAFLIYDKQGYKDYTGEEITQVDIPHPQVAPNIVNGDSSVVIALKATNRAVKLDAYYIKEK